ncbi:MAG: AarF/ABC1/UbiB kinase family protein, partial [Spirochaetia bacterium]|nr:AarF/ABC1/UbiB kinase family protein [Spirochaetia bacterium]
MAGIFDAIEFGVKGALRLGETARVLAGSGFEWLTGKTPPGPRLLRLTFERLGATYVKLGQFIASSPSIFPPEYVEEFQHCLDQTEPIPFSTVRRRIEKELGDPKKIFAEIEEKPIASASIAQVHAARLHTGESVVIKVQKPGVADVILTDMNFLYVFGRVLELLAPGLNRTSLADIIADTQKTMMEECDFLQEARNIKEFGEFLAKTGIEEVSVPRVYDKATTKRVLTMERFYGVPLTDLEVVKKYSKNPQQTLVRALNTWFASLLYCPFFHADVHAGNLLILEDGRVGFIDFGIVGRISKGTWQ